MRNFYNFRQAVEIPKTLNVNGLNLSKKYIPSAKTLHTEDLSNITFNYLCENSPYSLCHFWNHKSFSTTQLACIILAQKLHTFEKNIPLKCKFSDFPLLELKFIKFLMSFFKQKWVFVQSLDHSSVSWEITFLHFFSWNFNMLFTKVAHESANFQTCHC